MGIVAGGSLLVDYILTVAVSISSGADAFVAAFPSLYGHKVLIACLLVLFILILNLRGLTKYATVLSYPVYLFHYRVSDINIYRYFPCGDRRYSTTYACISRNCGSWRHLFLLLKAFSSGASSLTGVEAISNAVTNFREPSANNAVKTLIAIS